MKKALAEQELSPVDKWRSGRDSNPRRRLSLYRLWIWLLGKSITCVPGNAHWHARNDAAPTKIPTNLVKGVALFLALTSSANAYEWLSGLTPHTRTDPVAWSLNPAGCPAGVSGASQGLPNPRLDLS